MKSFIRNFILLTIYSASLAGFAEGGSQPVQGRTVRDCRPLLTSILGEEKYEKLNPDDVLIYAPAPDAPRVTIPDELECRWCGHHEPMPASLISGRVEHTRRGVNGWPTDLKLPEGFQGGAVVKCTGCAGGNPLWEMSSDPSEEPKWVGGDLHQIPLYVDPNFDHPKRVARGESGWRFTILSPDYLELADQSSETAQMARSGRIGLCAHCGNGSKLSPETSGFNCPTCAAAVTPENIFVYQGDEERGKLGRMLRLSTILASAPQPMPVVHEPVANGRERRRSQRAGSGNQQKQEVAAAGRQAMRTINRRGSLYAGVAAVALTAGASGLYIHNNIPTIGAGQVVKVDRSTNIATVQFYEVASDLLSESEASPTINSPEIYTIEVMLDQRSTLPGAYPYEIEVGTPVEIYYTWVDFHLFAAVVNPYSGLTLELDGSVVGPEGIR